MKEVRPQERGGGLSGVPFRVRFGGGVFVLAVLSVSGFGSGAGGAAFSIFAAARPAPGIVRGGGDPDSRLPIPALEQVKRQEAIRRARIFEEKRLQQLQDVRRLVQMAIHKSGADAQVLTLLRAERILVKMQEVRREERVARALMEVHRLMAAVPPPKTFTNRFGLEFGLVAADEAGGPAFYAALSPITVRVFRKIQPGEPPAAPLPPVRSSRSADEEKPGEAIACVDWDAAQAFARRLSAQTGQPYLLPSRAEAERLPRAEKYALWTRSEWKGPDPDHYALRRRYGVPMYEIVDPERRLDGKNTHLAELPFTRYRGLSFILVTPVSTGRLRRLTRLRGQLP